MKESKFVDTAEQASRLQESLEKLKEVPGPLMAALQSAQEIYGYVPFEVQNKVANFFDVPLQDLYGLSTFYSQFNLEPSGKIKVGVCMGTACYVKGSGKILDKIKSLLKIDPGQTDDERLYTLDATRCIGCCGLAPVITVNGDVYGRLGVDDIEGILKKYN